MLIGTRFSNCDQYLLNKEKNKMIYKNLEAPQSTHYCNDCFYLRKNTQINQNEQKLALQTYACFNLLSRTNGGIVFYDK